MEICTLILTASNDNWIQKDAGSVKRWWNRTKKDIEQTGKGFREGMSWSRWLSEKLFKQYGAQMEQLREIDDSITHWTLDLANLLDRAEESNKLGRMTDVLFWIGQINTRLQMVAAQKNKLKEMRDEQLEDFYGQGEMKLPEDYLGQMSLVSPEDLMSQAGVLDDLGRKITNWKMERLYAKRLKDQKEALNRLLRNTQKAVERVEGHLSFMGKARATGDIDSYLQNLDQISFVQQAFQNSFSADYNKHFKGMIERLKAKQPQVELPSLFEEESVQPTQTDTQTDKTVPAAPLPEALTTPEIPALDEVPQAPEPPTPEPKEEMSLEGTTPEELPEEVVEGLKSLKHALPPEENKPKELTAMEQLLLKKQHHDFYRELRKTAVTTQDPYLMARMVLKYSEDIENSDPQTSSELLDLAEEILG